MPSPVPLIPLIRPRGFFSLAADVLKKFPAGTTKTPEEWRKILQNKQVKRAELDYVGALSTKPNKYTVERGYPRTIFVIEDSDGHLTSPAGENQYPTREEAEMVLRKLMARPTVGALESWNWQSEEPVAVEDMIASFDPQHPGNRNLKVTPKKYKASEFDKEAAWEQARENAMNSKAYAGLETEAASDWITSNVKASVDEFEEEVLDAAGKTYTVTRYRPYLMTNTGRGVGERSRERLQDRLNLLNQDESTYDTFDEASDVTEKLHNRAIDDSDLQSHASEYVEIDDSHLIQQEYNTLESEGGVGDTKYGQYSIEGEEVPEGEYYEQTLHDFKNPKKWRSPHDWEDKENIFAHQRGLLEANFDDAPGQWSLSEERQSEPVNQAMKKRKDVSDKLKDMKSLTDEERKAIKFSGWDDEKIGSTKMALQEKSKEMFARAGGSGHPNEADYFPIVDRDGDWKIARLNYYKDENRGAAKQALQELNDANLAYVKIRADGADTPYTDEWQDQVNDARAAVFSAKDKFSKLADWDSIGSWKETREQAVGDFKAAGDWPNLWDQPDEVYAAKMGGKELKYDAENLSLISIGLKGQTVTPWRENYHEQLMRQQLMDMAASDDKYAGMAWTTGQTQAQRWSHENHISSFDVTKAPDGTYSVTAKLKRDDSKVSLGSGFTKETLADKLRLGGIEYDKAVAVSEQMTALADGMPAGYGALLDTKDIPGLVTGGEGYIKGYDDLSLAEARRIGKPFGIEPEEAKYKGKSVWRMRTPRELLDKINKEGFPLWTLPAATALGGALFTGEDNQAEAGVLSAAKRGFRLLEAGEASVGKFRGALSSAVREDPSIASSATMGGPQELDGTKSGIKLFLSEDNKAGFAIDPSGKIIRTFNAPSSNVKDFPEAVIEIGKESGATKMDLFDSEVDGYSGTGLRPTAKKRTGTEPINYMAIDPDREFMSPGYVPSDAEGERARDLTLQRIKSGLSPEEFRARNQTAFLRDEPPTQYDVNAFNDAYYDSTFKLPDEKPQGWRDTPDEEWQWDFAGKRAAGDPTTGWNVLNVQPPLDPSGSSYLDLLRTPERYRGQHLASNSMDELNGLADDYGINQQLKPVSMASDAQIASNKGLDQQDLEDFYSSKGYEYENEDHWSRQARLPRSAGALAAGSVGTGALMMGSDEAEAAYRPGLEEREIPMDIPKTLWSRITDGAADLMGVRPIEEMEANMRATSNTIAGAAKGFTLGTLGLPSDLLSVMSQAPANAQSRWRPEYQEAPFEDVDFGYQALPLGMEDLAARTGVDIDDPGVFTGSLLSGFGLKTLSKATGFFNAAKSSKFPMERQIFGSNILPRASKITRKPLPLLENANAKKPLALLEKMQ